MCLAAHNELTNRQCHSMDAPTADIGHGVLLFPFCNCVAMHSDSTPLESVILLFSARCNTPVADSVDICRCDFRPPGAESCGCAQVVLE